MSDMDRLVEGLSAHLDKVERAASDDALLTGLARTSGSEHHYDARCRLCGWERYGGRRSELRPMVASHVRHLHPDQVASVAPPERLGLVRATRDLIDQWREAVGELKRATPCDAGYHFAMGAACAAEVAVLAAARGWGVETDDNGGVGVGPQRFGFPR